MTEQRLVKITRDSDGESFTVNLKNIDEKEYLRDWWGIPDSVLDLLFDEAFVYGLEE